MDVLRSATLVGSIFALTMALYSIISVWTINGTVLKICRAGERALFMFSYVVSVTTILMGSVIVFYVVSNTINSWKEIAMFAAMLAGYQCGVSISIFIIMRDGPQHRHKDNKKCLEDSGCVRNDSISKD